MERTVVCCVDDSELASAVLRWGRTLADALELRLVLVHVAPRTELPGISAAAAGQERLRDEELAAGRALLERLLEGEQTGRVETRVEIGDPAGRIVALSGELGADLVVLGSRGRGDLSSAVLGSVSHAVAGRARCPVVVVPSNVDERSQ